jgi:hypothetical protein
VPETLAPLLVGINGLQPYIRLHQHLIMKPNSLTGTNALTIALIMATPVQWRRRSWALLWGMLLINAFHLVLCGRFYMERIDHRFASHAFAGLETNRRCSGIHAYLTVGDQFFSPCANLDCRPIPASGFREIRGGRLARAKPLRYPKSVIATFLQRCLPSHESQCLRAGNRSVRADAADRLQAISAASSLDAV